MALLARGTQLQVEDSPGAGTYTTIPGCRNITGPSGGAQPFEVTDHDSTAKEYLVDLPDEGEITATLNWDPDETLHIQLWTDRAGQTVRKYRLRWGSMSTPKATTFDAYVTNLSPDADAQGAALGASLTLKITGPTTTPA